VNEYLPLYIVVFGDLDGLSALVVDVLRDILVVQIRRAGMGGRKNEINWALQDVLKHAAYFDEKHGKMR